MNNINTHPIIPLFEMTGIKRTQSNQVCGGVQEVQDNEVHRDSEIIILRLQRQ